MSPAADTNGADLYTVPLLIDNEEYPSSSSFAVHSPATGSHIHNGAAVSIADADVALQSCAKACASWRALPPTKKRDIFLRASQIMDSRRDELQKYMVAETGASSVWADFNLNLASNIILDLAGKMSSVQGSIPQTGEEGVSALVYKEPYGVILAIAPWNAPYILGVRAVAYALAAGNTCILKAPELSPRCSWAIATCFHRAGLPAGVLNLIAHEPSAAAAVTKHLIESPIIKKINFTGSTMVGKIIAELAGRNLKPILLELGGKAPAIVWEDADLKLAAEQCAKGAFLHSGQICMSTERIIVHENIIDAFEAEYKKAVAAFAPSEKEAGVLISKLGVDKCKRLLADAVSKGAEIVHGSADAHEDVGTKMRPVVIKGTTKDMELYYTESFGPTVSIVVVKTEEEALAVANDTEYGLSSAVFTRDLGRGLRFAKQIESGACHINSMTVHDEVALPHGGMKASGYGRFSGTSGIEEWVRTKTITFRD
ncbi:putative salicylaldehyde dehydrogenase [Coleophoma cylindrospora]|uniref:Putative salicylaldehyde dehydrogenase n=1 Tax=Coleophoma cylindrospora TaxID=1849047 RepID=A0A3D8S8N0_9HELO|nr:putative salicylaldehyde dehydrogenase [Coleophoma cylindrospora]